MSFVIRRVLLYFSKCPSSGSSSTCCHTFGSYSSRSKSNSHFTSTIPSAELEQKLTPYKNAVKEQGHVVRSLKENNASKEELNRAIADLKLKKHALQEKEQELCPPVEKVDKAKLEDLLKQRFFYDQSFSIYGGVQGLYDFGPMGCAVKANLLHEWRNFFILADHMLEIDSPVLTPERVLKASGHIDRFADHLVSDSVTGESFRADHLVRRGLESVRDCAEAPPDRRQAAEVALGSVDSLDTDGLQGLIDRFGIKSPTTGHQLTRPRPFNLMLETSAGAPSAGSPAQRLFLRPETAQGIFVNFRRLLDTVGGQLPMAVAQVGSCFRNEIAPRSGLIRLREFTLAEIEHFYDPADSRHPSFATVANLSLPLLSAADQRAGGRAEAVWQPLGAAVASAGGPIAHETLAYYLGCVYRFLTARCGIDPRRLRFRQHPPGEMAHYAADCWDAECLIALSGEEGGAAWVECVGCADRAAYDLTRHAAASGERLAVDRQQQQLHGHGPAVIDEAALEKAFKSDARQVSAFLKSLSQERLHQLHSDIASGGGGGGGVSVQISGREFRLQPGMLSLQPAAAAPVVPCVVEPSFGIGRVIAAVLEHSFRVRQSPAGSRDSGRRTYLSLPACLAPYKCALLPMSGASAAMSALTGRLSQALTEAGVSHRVDATQGASIGKRYARNDQIGVPYAVTVDFDSVAGTAAGATLRERDSMRQVRVEIEKIPDLLQQLVHGKITWEQVMETYPVFHQQIVTREK